MTNNYETARDAYLYCTQKKCKGTTYKCIQNTITPRPEVYVYCKNDNERNRLDVLSTNTGWQEFYISIVCKGNVKNNCYYDGKKVYTLKEFENEIYINW